MDPLMVQTMGLLKGQRMVDEMVEMNVHWMVLLWVRQMDQSLDVQRVELMAKSMVDYWAIQMERPLEKDLAMQKECWKDS